MDGHAPVSIKSIQNKLASIELDPQHSNQDDMQIPSGVDQHFLFVYVPTLVRNVRALAKDLGKEDLVASEHGDEKDGRETATFGGLDTQEGPEILNELGEQWLKFISDKMEEKFNEVSKKCRIQIATVWVNDIRIQSVISLYSNSASDSEATMDQTPIPDEVAAWGERISGCKEPKWCRWADLDKIVFRQI